MKRKQSTPRGAKTFTRLEVAKRQIDVAIWLWFHNADIVSIHTLTAAAFGVLDDLFHHRTKGRLAPFDPLPKGMERETRKLFKEAEGFFEHARKDSDKILFHPPAWTEVCLFSTVTAFLQLTAGDTTPTLMQLFLLRFALKHPGKFSLDAFPFLDDRFDIKKLKKLSNLEFFEDRGGHLPGGLLRGDRPP